MTCPKCTAKDRQLADLRAENARLADRVLTLEAHERGERIALTAPPSHDDVPLVDLAAVFRHYHQRDPDNDRRCRACRRDLLDPVHRREGQGPGPLSNRADVLAAIDEARALAGKEPARG